MGKEKMEKSYKNGDLEFFSEKITSTTQYAGHMLVICWSYVSHMLDMSLICVRYVLDMCLI